MICCCEFGVEDGARSVQPRIDEDAEASGKFARVVLWRERGFEGEEEAAVGVELLHGQRHVVLRAG